MYAGLRTDFYKIVDDIIAGSPTNQNVKDCAPGSAVGTTILNLQQKQYRIANLLGNAARLVFHDAGEVDIRTVDKYGMDGCLSKTDPNAGLKTSETIAMNLIEQLFQVLIFFRACLSLYLILMNHYFYFHLEILSMDQSCRLLDTFRKDCH